MDGQRHAFVGSRQRLVSTLFRCILRGPLYLVPAVGVQLSLYAVSHAALKVGFHRGCCCPPILVVHLCPGGRPERGDGLQRRPAIGRARHMYGRILHHQLPRSCGQGKSRGGCEEKIIA